MNFKIKSKTLESKKAYWSFFLTCSREWGLWEYATLTRAMGRTLSQGVDQSTWPLQGGNRRRRDGQKKEKPQKSGQSLSSLLSQCHTLWPLSVTISLPGPGRLAGDTLPLLHSIRLWLFQHLRTRTAEFPLSFTDAYFTCLCQGDFCRALFIAALHHRHSCQSSPYSTGPGSRLRAVLFFAPSQSPPCL